MMNTVGRIGTGKQFVFGNTRYVRTPEMGLQCGSWGFVINCMRIIDNDQWDPPIIIADYLLPETKVELVS